VPVKLADGQEWLFPKPFLQIHASFAGGKPAGNYPVITAGPELDELVEAMASCEDAAAQLSAAATLGAYLLLRNYDLEDRELDQLFAFRPGDPPSWDWAQRILEVGAGQTGVRSFSDGNG
jgi:hypothetical protein